VANQYEELFINFLASVAILLIRTQGKAGAEKILREDWGLPSRYVEAALRIAGELGGGEGTG